MLSKVPCSGTGSGSLGKTSGLSKPHFGEKGQVEGKKRLHLGMVLGTRSYTMIVRGERRGGAGMVVAMVKGSSSEFGSGRSAGSGLWGIATAWVLVAGGSVAPGAGGSRGYAAHQHGWFAAA